MARRANASRKMTWRRWLNVKTIQVPRRFVASAWGGTETVILQTSRAFKAAGHDTKIFTSLALSDQREEQMEEIDIRRFPYHYPFFGLGSDDIATLDQKGGNLLSLSLLWGLLRESAVDLFHAHSGKRLGAIVRTAARLRGAPYVVSLHGGHFDVPPSESEQLLAPIRNTWEWGKPFGALLGSRRVLEDAAALICVGENEAKVARTQLPNQRVEFVPNGVDSAAFASGDADRFRNRYGLGSKRKLILCIGRIDYQKNQLGLLDAFAVLLSEDVDAHLVLIGPITIASYRERIDARIAALGVGSRVTLIPGLAPDDDMLPAAYQAADVFCLPSLHEPFGIVILEAWAARCPVVAAGVGGVLSFTTDGENVVHVCPEDPHSIAAGLRTVLTSPELALRIAAQGEREARTRYDWSRIAEQMLDIYTDVAA